MEQTEPGHKLAQYLEVMKEVFDHAPDSISVADLAGKLVYQNQVAARLIGCTVEECNAAGGTSGLYVRPELEDEAMQAVISGGKWEGEVEIKSGSGEALPALLKASGITDGAGGTIGVLGILSDVSRQARAREDLRRSEAYFRSLIESAHDIIMVLDREGNTLYVSPSFERAFGFRPDEVVGTSAFAYIHPDDLERLGHAFREGVEVPGRSINMEYRVRHKEKGWRYVEAIGKNLLEDPAVAGVVINSRDVTERKKYEEALRESEESLRRINDNMIDMVSQVSVEGLFEYVGLSHQARLGYEPAQLLGHSIFEHIHPDDLEGLVARYAEGLQQPGAVLAEYRYRHAAGHYLWMESHANPLFDGEGKLVGAILGTRDITGRKRTEERLEKLNRCFLSLGTDFQDNIQMLVVSGREIMGSSLMVYCRPSRGERDECFASWEKEGVSLSEEAKDRLHQDVARQGPGRAMVVEGIRESDYALLVPDSAESGIQRLLACPVSLKEEISGFLCLMDGGEEAFSREEVEIMGMLARSISIEEERWAYEEVLRDFINITSHELRHPITLMKGYSEVLKSFGDELDEATRRKALDAIDNGTVRLNKLISELLDTSRIERGTFTIYRQEADLAALAGIVVGEMQAKGARNPFVIDMPAGHAGCRADPEKMLQLLVILLENAVKYSPTDGVITIRARSREEGILVSVMDHGPGVPEEERKRIFDRLYQVGDAIYHSVPGIGLGLYIARKIVETHGGHIWHEPGPEGGSIFSFTLP